MTYTVIGLCPREGKLGVAVATYSVAVGALCPQVQSNVGAMSSQAFVNPELRILAMSLLKDGHSAKRALDMVVQSDPDIDYRQVGIIDREGRVAVYTGQSTRTWAGHILGDGYAVFGNVLAGSHVVEAMAKSMEVSVAEPFSERLLRAIEAGCHAGGQRGSSGQLPERSASLLVHGHGALPEIDLRADMHPHAVLELRRIYNDYLPYISYHRQRWLSPATAQPQETFVSGLISSAVV